MEEIKRLAEAHELATEIMNAKGYTETATGNKGTTIFYLKKIGTGPDQLNVHGYVNLFRTCVTLDIIGMLDLGISIRSMDLPLDSNLFDKTEETLINYITLLTKGVLKEKKEKVEKSVEERKSEFWDVIRNIAKEKGYEKPMCLEFYNYWTAKNEKGKLMEFEKERTFDHARRLTTWLLKDKKWNARYASREEKKVEIQNTELEQTGKKHIKHSDLF